jgi:hypothetical protein
LGEEKVCATVTFTDEIGLKYADDLRKTVSGTSGATSQKPAMLTFPKEKV